jgi:Ca-activated chloride channel family protein
MRRLLLALASAAVAASALLAAAPPARADGFLVPLEPRRPVRRDWAVTYHRVDVEVGGQKAHVRVDEEFTNLASSALEAEYVFPLPAGAMVSGVTLMVDGRGMEGRLLRADEARRIYDDIVRRQKDPALVEYVGRDFFRASIFPIPPGGARQLVLEYDQLLPRDGETIELLYPLNTEKFSAKPLHDVSVRVRLQSATGIGAIYSPTHDVIISRPDSKRAEATFRAREVRPETDFLLYWGETGAEVGATLLTHWPRGEDRGYFLLLASPTLPDGQRQAAKPKDVVLCVDVSGSMAGPKLEQTKAAVRQVLGGLNDGDRFNVIKYSNGVVPLWDTSTPLTAASRKEAMDFVEQMQATGGTNIHDALMAALGQPAVAGMPKVVLFMTDGRPTLGETTDVEEILRRAKKANAGGAVRIFVFGVGVDVNPVLLDRLALDHHGVPTYVRPNEDVERKVAALYEKVRFPVLTDVRVDFGGLSPSEVLPGSAPDLFRGGQVVLAGRYRKGGPVDVVVSGKDGAEGREFHYKLAAGEEGQGLRDDFPARVWALRRIGDLVDQVRLLGRPEKELVDEIVRLSTKFGIMTEYTSFLADERADHGRVADNTVRALDELRRMRGGFEEGAAGGAPDAGAAFAAGENQKARREADKPVPAPAATPPPAARPAAPGDEPKAPSGGGSGGVSGPAFDRAGGKQYLAKSKEGAKGRDVDDEAIEGVQNVGNRAFYKRSLAVTRRGAWVDAEVKDAAQVDERVARWSPRFFELLATTSADENKRLSQEGDVLLRIAGKNVLVEDEAGTDGK